MSGRHPRQRSDLRSRAGVTVSRGARRRAGGHPPPPEKKADESSYCFGKRTGADPGRRARAGKGQIRTPSVPGRGAEGRPGSRGPREVPSTDTQGTSGAACQLPEQRHVQRMRWSEDTCRRLRGKVCRDPDAHVHWQLKKKIQGLWAQNEGQAGLSLPGKRGGWPCPQGEEAGRVPGAGALSPLGTITSYHPQGHPSCRLGSSRPRRWGPGARREGRVSRHSS